MRLRVSLRSPVSEPVTRDIVDGVWAEPTGEADQHLGVDSWALPGLADAHAHLAGVEPAGRGDLEGAMKRSREALSAGLMLILDKGWSDTTCVEAIGKVPETERPDVEAAARMITVEGGYFPGFGREVDPTELADAVAEEAGRGRGWVKLVGDWPRRGVGPVANFDGGQLTEAVAVAERTGSRVAVHTMAREVPGLAVAAGVQSIEHGLFLTEDDLGPLGDRDGMWVPTIGRMEETVRLLGERSSGGKLLLEGLENVRRLLPEALEAGVHVLAGTDLVGAPAAVASEVMKLAEYGLTNHQAVRAVATSALVATGRPGGFEPGSPANAVLFPADPTRDLEVLRSPETVIRLGVPR